MQTINPARLGQETIRHFCLGVWRRAAALAAPGAHMPLGRQEGNPQAFAGNPFPPGAWRRPFGWSNGLAFSLVARPTAPWARQNGTFAGDKQP
jgi:hypothetical protein